MKLIISSSASEPIYEQIISQIKAKILAGELVAGDNLPSIRALSKSLHISIMTVQRAYEDLQRDGFIKTTPGKGTYVSLLRDEFVLEERVKKLEDIIQEAVELAIKLDIDIDRFKELVDVIYEGD